MGREVKLPTILHLLQLVHYFALTSRHRKTIANVNIFFLHLLGLKCLHRDFNNFRFIWSQKADQHISCGKSLKRQSNSKEGITLSNTIISCYWSNRIKLYKNSNKFSYKNSEGVWIIKLGKTWIKHCAEIEPKKDATKIKNMSAKLKTKMKASNCRLL